VHGKVAALHTGELPLDTLLGGIDHDTGSLPEDEPFDLHETEQASLADPPRVDLVDLSLAQEGDLVEPLVRHAAIIQGASLPVRNRTGARTPPNDRKPGGPQIPPDEGFRHDGIRVAEHGRVDRPLDPEFKRRRDRRRSLSVALGIAGLAGAFGWGTSWLRPSVTRAAIRTASVDVGPIEATISATGTVVPEVERVLSSPFDTRVMRILKQPGSALTTGEPILELDLQASRVAADELRGKVARKEIEQAETRLGLEKTLNDLEGRQQIKKLELESNRAQLARHEQLRAAGLLSIETYRQTELAAAQCAIELGQLEKEAGNARAASATRLRGLALELAALRGEAGEARRQLDLGTTRSDRDGVLTWTVTEEGIAVRKGDVIARVADLRSFRVLATVSDLHARTLRPGLPAIVRVGEERLRGTVSDVRPTIQNGAITFIVSLEDRSSPLLKSNLRVDVDVVTDQKARALRLGRGPAVGGGGSQDVFVIRGDRAIRTPVHLGLASFDRVEVKDGLREGDVVIVSDVSAYLKAQELGVR
jgi:HlyD family secretion protein